MATIVWKALPGLVFVLLLMPLPGGAQDVAALPAAIATRISEIAMLETPIVAGDSLSAFEVIEKFYVQRRFEPVWASRERAQALIGAIRDSSEDGLTPADYHITRIMQLTGVIYQSGATAAQHADFDLLMMDAAIRLGYHLWFGKVDPVSFDAAWNLSRRIPGFDPVVEMEKVLASTDLGATIRAQRPQLPLYEGLKRELARFNTIALRGGWESVPAGPSLKPGGSDERVPALRARLLASGDLSRSEGDARGGDAAIPDALLYDAALAAAVRRYQKRMGIASDGIVGAGTLGELNVPVEKRIRQLRVNLDRGRVLLYDLPEQFVVVNIASQELYVVRDQKVIWSARAQVGRPYRQTPEYRSEINYLVFNPTWTVPPNIIRNDILPAARRDPHSITRKGLKVLDAAGRELSPAAVDWSRFKSGHIPYTLRQDPGPANALGRVKFMFPNPYSVYLHDTPSKNLFDVDSRTTSSGCVRVDRAMELAELMLADADRWSRAQIDRVVDAGKLQNVPLVKKVPLLLVYWSAWVDADGVVNFRPDIYGRDEKWSRGLDAPFSFRRTALGL